MNDGKLRFYNGGKEVFVIDDSSWRKVQTPKIQLEIKQNMNNYIPDDDVIEEMLHTKLTDEKKEDLARLREENKKRKVRFNNIKYTDVFERDQVLTVKEMISYAWHEVFTFEEVEGEYGTIFFEDVEDT